MILFIVLRQIRYHNSTCWAMTALKNSYKKQGECSVDMSHPAFPINTNVEAGYILVEQTWFFYMRRNNIVESIWGLRLHHHHYGPIYVDNYHDARVLIGGNFRTDLGVSFLLIDTQRHFYIGLMTRSLAKYVA